MAAEGVFPKSDGDILYASEVNVFNRGTWYGLTSMPTVDSVAILAHSTTDWTLINGTATMITGDAGASWANASSDDGNMTAVSKVSVADPTKAISCDSNSGNVIITSDSGDNWTNASTDPAGITKVFDLSFPTATVAVVACDLGGAARGIFFSTDAGDNWTICTSGPAVDVMAIDMVDGSDGIAIDVNQNIWTTSDGGDNWSDSGQNVLIAPGTQATIIALTSTTGVMITQNETTIQTFNTTSGGTRTLSAGEADEATSYFGNLCKTTNGNIYVPHFHFTEDGEEPITISLLKSEDGGATWSMKELGSNLFVNTTSSLAANNSKSVLVEYDTNKLLLLNGLSALVKIDES